MTPLKNRSAMLDCFKHQTNIDLTDVLESRVKNSRTYLGFHLDELTKTEQKPLAKSDL